MDEPVRDERPESDRKSGREDEPERGLVIGPTSGAADVELVTGPVGRTVRPDDRIRTEVERRISASSLADHGIAVTVIDGTVTLRGPVRDTAEAHLAEQIADAVSGVRAVETALHVARSAGEPGAGPTDRQAA
jgi:BON domain-containing protein